VVDAWRVPPSPGRVAIPLRVVAQPRHAEPERRFAAAAPFRPEE